MQMRQNFVKVFWVHGHVPQVCCEKGFVKFLFQSDRLGLMGIGAHDHCLRRPMSDPLCPQKRVFHQRTSKSLSKTSGHDNG